MRGRKITLEAMDGTAVEVQVFEIGVPQVRAMWAYRERLEAKPLAGDDLILADYVAADGLLPADLYLMTDLTEERLMGLSIQTIRAELIPACREVNPDFFAGRARIMASALGSQLPS